jgi:putative membrane protein
MVWFLSFHIIGFILWMGGLLDMTRILGYHVKEQIPVQERLSWMEKRMFFFVATPGMAITIIFGVCLFFAQGGFHGYLPPSIWFHIKMSLVLILIGIHFFIAKQILFLRDNPQNMSPVRFKAIHGITGLALIAIVLLVIGKPWSA